MPNKKKLIEKKQTAMAMMQANNLTAARTILIDVCKKDKRDAEAFHMLGIVHARMGHLVNGVDCFTRVVTLRPKFAEGHDNLGMALQGVGQLAQAEKSFKKAINRNRHYKKAYLNLAQLLRQQGNFSGAITYLNSSIKDSAPDPMTYFTLGSIYSETGNQNEAASSYKAAIELKPDFFEAYGCLGGVYNKQGKLADAIEVYNHMLQLNSDSPDTIAAIAQIHEKQGEAKKAYELLENIVDKYPGNTNIALTLGLVARNIPVEKYAIQVILTALNYNETIDNNVRAQLYRLLGGLYDKLESYSDAFEYYKQANDLTAYPFDVDASLGEFSRLKKVFCTSFFERLATVSKDSRSPIFVVGMIRSGTSLVEQILCSHPLVFGAGELDNVFNIANSMVNEFDQKTSYPECMSSLSQESITAAATKYLEYTSELSSGSKNVVDKMPHNFLNLGLIEILFPNARIIHCMRQPMDTCLSCYFQDFGGRHPYTKDLSNLGAYYKQYQDLMQHWKSVLSIEFLEINYENLVKDPEKSSRQMIDFCGLGWDKNCLKFNTTNRVVKTASYYQVRQPLYTKSIERWKNYEYFLKPLNTALK